VVFIHGMADGLTLRGSRYKGGAGYFPDYSNTNRQTWGLP